MARGVGEKKRLNRTQRVGRAVKSLFTPGAWFHMLRMMNYYYHTHVLPLKSVRRGTECSISPDAVFSNAERIMMGDRVRIGSRCHIWAGHANATIEIGDDCLFGPEVMVTAATYRFNDGHPVTMQKMDEEDIVIGRDVWLGTRAIVLPGARIGDGAIIGAGALVKGDIPPMAIAVGQPARVVGRREISSSDVRVS